jgi:hypothetical protein
MISIVLDDEPMYVPITLPGEGTILNIFFLADGALPLHTLTLAIRFILSFMYGRNHF